MGKILGFGVDAPHLQEHAGKTAYGFAAEHHGGILPMAEQIHAVDIFVSQIDAAGEGYLTVDHQNFAVVTVIIMGGEEGHQRCERFALDAHFFQLLIVAAGETSYLTGAVIHDAYFYALRGFALQDV